MKKLNISTIKQHLATGVFQGSKSYWILDDMTYPVIINGGCIITAKSMLLDPSDDEESLTKKIIEYMETHDFNAFAFYEFSNENNDKCKEDQFTAKIRFGGIKIT